MVDYDLGKVVGDKGEQGDEGNGIVSITKTSTSGLVDTYTILFTNGTTTTFEVTNGSSGIADIVTSWSATLSDTKVPSEKLAKNSLDAKLDNAISSTAVTIASNDNILITDYSDSNKVKRVSSILASQMKDSNAHSNIGSSANASQSTINTNIDTALSGKANSSSLSTVATTGSYNDLTNKPTIPSISGLEETANKVTSWSTTTTDAHYPSEKLVKTSLDAKANSSSLSTVATSGSYTDLSNKPSIPSKVSDLQNDAGYLDSSDVGAVALSNDYDDLSNKPTLFSGSYADLSNKPSYTATITSSTTGAYEIGKINVSGSSQTIYGKDTGGTSVDIVTAWESTPSDSKVASEKLTKDSLDGKLDNAISSTAVSIASSDNILITDYSDSNKVKRVANILATQVKDYNSHSNIGSDANATQGNINSNINIALGNKVSKSSTSGLLKNDGTVDTTQYLSSLPSHNHDDRYYTESEMDTALASKQATLVSGTNLKTINNTSLLGSGNIDISGGGSGGSCVTDFFIDSNTDEWVIETSACSQGEVVTAWSSTLTDTKVPSEKLVKNYVDGLVGSAIQYIVGSGS